MSEGECGKEYCSDKQSEDLRLRTLLWLSGAGAKGEGGGWQKGETAGWGGIA